MNLDELALLQEEVQDFLHALSCRRDIVVNFNSDHVLVNCKGCNTHISSSKKECANRQIYRLKRHFSYDEVRHVGNYRNHKSVTGWWIEDSCGDFMLRTPAHTLA